MIDAILPPSAGVGETFAELAEELFPEEEVAIARAVDKRRREFRSARGCARIALGKLGIDRPPLVPGRRGAPTWPDGVVGSMTHCAGYRAAAVAPSTLLAGLGIDAEPDAPLPEGVLGSVSSAGERAQLDELHATHPGVHWDRLLFSAKESVYKVWSPLTGTWLGFEEAELTVDPVGGTFRARLLVPGLRVGGRDLTFLDGRWTAACGLVVTAVALPVPGEPHA